MSRHLKQGPANIVFEILCPDCGQRIKVSGLGEYETFTHHNASINSDSLCKRSGQLLTTSDKLNKQKKV